jgi:hypothetical protein
MKQGKEVKAREEAPKDTTFDGFDPDVFYNNTLSLPESLKAEMTEKGLDWRFLNSNEFRRRGNMHKSYWQPYKPTGTENAAYCNAEGLIQRGDLILGARQKRISALHKDYLDKKNRANAGINREQARQLKKMAVDAGVGKAMKIHEGYEENE